MLVITYLSPLITYERNALLDNFTQFCKNTFAQEKKKKEYTCINHSFERWIQCCSLVLLGSKTNEMSRRGALLSHVRLFATLWIVACHTPLTMGFSRQEHRSGLSFPPPGNLPDPGIKPMSPAVPALAADSLQLRHLGRRGTQMLNCSSQLQILGLSCQQHLSFRRSECPSPFEGVHLGWGLQRHWTCLGYLSIE